ncbi:hypothetical protein LINPERPRIM_LOCUS11714 [Linum perenne]
MCDVHYRHKFNVLSFESGLFTSAISRCFAIEDFMKTFLLRRNGSVMRSSSSSKLPTFRSRSGVFFSSCTLAASVSLVEKC